MMKTGTRAKEDGLASLITAVILLIGATLILLVSSGLITGQTRLTANTYRTSQAFEAAQSGIDEGVALFNRNKQTIDTSLTEPSTTDLTTIQACSFDSGTVFEGPSATAISTISGPKGYFFFANIDSDPNDRCGGGSASDTSTLIAVGFSDDCEAQRTVSVCLGTADILSDGEGPKQPLVTGGSIGNAGNTSIINRYTNISIWAGGSSANAGNSFGTFLRPSGFSVEDFSDAELMDNDRNNVQQVSNRDSGYGLDVVLNDPSLDSVTRDEFWGIFFGDNSRTTLFNKSSWYHESDPDAINSWHDDNAPQNSIVNRGSYIWIGPEPTYDGAGEPVIPATTYPNAINSSLPDIGLLDVDNHLSNSDPAVIIVNGDLELNAGDTIYGIVYVTGELKITGTPTVYGSVVVEKGPNTLGGTLNVVYTPIGGEGNAKVTDPTAGVIIPGSWRDW